MSIAYIPPLTIDVSDFERFERILEINRQLNELDDIINGIKQELDRFAKASSL